MQWLREYRKNPDRLSDLLPWAALVAPGTVLLKNGAFQKTLRYRGPDLDSATAEELVILSARINNVLRRLGDGWALWAEATRIHSEEYPDSNFPDPISYLIDEERRATFEELTHYESYFYLTFTYLSNAQGVRRASEFFLERGEKQEEGESAKKTLDNFLTEITRIKDLLSSSLNEVYELTDEETLTYLKSTVSEKSHRVRTPEIPMYLDSFLTDSDLLPGFEPKLGRKHLRCISVRGFPGSSQPGLLDNLNRLGIEYRWVTRFIWLPKHAAEKELASYRRKWFAKRKDIFTLLRETFFGQESVQVDTDAVRKSQDANEALEELLSDQVAYGYFATFLVLLDEDEKRLKGNVAEVERIINGLGFVCSVETVNAVDSYLASVPGNANNYVRRPLLHTLNLAHMMPGISSVWAGPQEDSHLNAPVILQGFTNGSTKFRFTTKVGDVGHALILGPTGAGKSFLLNLIQAQFLRYPGAQVYTFDKGGSSRVLCTACGGEYYDLGGERSALAFQPLAEVNELHYRRWAQEWCLALFAQEKLDITPKIKEELWTALTSLASAPRTERTLYGLMLLLQNHELRSAILPYTVSGPYGQLLDSSEDTLSYAPWQAFEMEKLMETPSVVMPVLSYLFHRLERRFCGTRPSLLVLDEAWLFLDNPIFEKKIREWLKVLRKANCSVIFATQSLSDVADSKISATLKEACLTKVYLPNANARNEDSLRVYRAFGLNNKQVQIIAESLPKRHYYYSSVLGNRLFELGAGELTSAYCGATSKAVQVSAQKLYEQSCGNLYQFNELFLRERALNWAAESLALLRAKERSISKVAA